MTVSICLTVQQNSDEKLTNFCNSIYYSDYIACNVNNLKVELTAKNSALSVKDLENADSAVVQKIFEISDNDSVMNQEVVMKNLLKYQENDFIVNKIDDFSTEELKNSEKNFKKTSAVEKNSEV